MLAFHSQKNDIRTITGRAQNPSMMVALEMPREFKSHPVMKQVIDDPFILSWLKCLVFFFFCILQLQRLAKPLARSMRFIVLTAVNPADSVCNGQRDPTRYRNTFQVSVMHRHLPLFDSLRLEPICDTDNDASYCSTSFRFYLEMNHVFTHQRI